MKFHFRFNLKVTFNIFEQALERIHRQVASQPGYFAVKMPFADS